MDARLRSRCFILCAVGIVATAALASACGGGGGTANAASAPPQLETYRGGGVSFRHPAAWTAYPYRGAGELHYRPLVYLSTQAIHDPCSTHGAVTTCGLPVGRLQPGGVLVVWQVNGIPAMALGPGARIRVGGHPATRVVTSSGVCKKVGADRTIQVVVETSPTPSPLTYFTACLRGPNLAQNERRVDALLASTRLSSQ
jgi:hypothetical protein